MFGIDDAIFAAGTLASVGLKLFGSNETNKAEQQMASEQQDITKLEMQQNQVRRSAMELGAQRMQIQQIRQAQQARAQATSSAVGQGAQYGSGLQGGLAGITSSTNFNTLGVRQNEELGENMFNLTDQISKDKIAMSQFQSQAMEGQAWSQLGSTIGGATGAMSRLGGGFGGNNPFGFLFGGGSPSGYGN